METINVILRCACGELVTEQEDHQRLQDRSDAGMLREMAPHVSEGIRPAAPERRKPTPGKEYWEVTREGLPGSAPWKEHEGERGRCAWGNVLEKKAEAEQAREKVQEVRLALHQKG